MCLAVLAPPVGRYFVLKASHLALAFLLPPQGEKCQQRDIVEMMEAVGFGPTLGISPIRLPQIPFLFGFMLP